jgi:hypothetical protein
MGKKINIMCIGNTYIMGAKQSAPAPAPAPVFPDRTPQINDLSRRVNELNEIYNTEIANKNNIQATINNTNDDTKQYTQLTTGYRASEPKTWAVLYSKQGDVANARSKFASLQKDKEDTTTSVNTNASLLVAELEHQVSQEINNYDTIEDTNDKTHQTYYGMNRTNHSILNTMNNNASKHTTDVSRIRYQLEHTDYFSNLNSFLLLLYALLLIVLVLMLYKMQVNINIFMKISIVSLLIVFPYCSLFYYKYIYKQRSN